MRRPTVSTPFGVLFAFYLLAFVFFTVRAIFTFPAQELLGVFMWPHVWSRAFLDLMRYAIPVTVAGTAVAYSLLSSPPVGTGVPIHGFVSSHFVGLVALTVLFTALFLGLQPRVAVDREQLYALSTQARVYLAQAESALATGDRRSALHSYERYMTIDADNREIQSRATDLRTALYGEAGTPAREQETGQRLLLEKLSEGLSPPELMDLADRFMSDGDYFTAYYYANLAVQIDSRRSDARRLAAKAQEMIRRFDPTPLEQREARLFVDKRRGFDLYTSGEYVESYRVFFALQEEAPRDPEVAKYLEASRIQLARQAFFLDEARAAEAMPGVERLLFLNPRQENLREVVYLGKMSRTPEGVFFVDIEVAGFTSTKLLYHYGAPYGKLYDGQVNLYGIERRESQSETHLVVYRGTVPSGNGEVPEMLSLVPGIGVLPTLKSERGSLDSQSFFALWRVRRQITEFGHLEAPIGLEIVKRILIPFSFLVLALAGMSAGFRFRADRARRPGWPAYVLMPIFPLVALYLSSFYIFAQRVIVAFVMVRSGFLAALIVLLALQALALFLALIALAGQSAD
jgi:hypothetical protein